MKKEQKQEWQGCIQKIELGGAKRDSLKFRGARVTMCLWHMGGSGGSSQRRGLKFIIM